MEGYEILLWILAKVESRPEIIFLFCTQISKVKYGKHQKTNRHQILKSKKTLNW